MKVTIRACWEKNYIDSFSQILFLKYSAAIDESDTTFNFETKEGADRPVCTFGGDLLLPRQAGHGHLTGHHGETLSSVSDAG